MAWGYRRRQGEGLGKGEEEDEGVRPFDGVGGHCWRRRWRPSFPSEAILAVCCSQRPPLASAVIVGVGGRR